MFWNNCSTSGVQYLAVGACSGRTTVFCSLLTCGIDRLSGAVPTADTKHANAKILKARGLDLATAAEIASMTANKMQSLGTW